MADQQAAKFSEILKKNQDKLLADWLGEQTKSSARRDDLISPGESQEQSRRFLFIAI